MSAVTALIPLEEYLNTAYEPDCDFIDGLLEERNVGKRRHSRTQLLLGAWFHTQEQSLQVQALTEQRVRIAPRRVRIPDLCVVAAGVDEEVLETPPLLWVEILSPDDRFSRVQTRVSDALQFGVPTVWIIDPYSKEAWIVTPSHGTAAVTDGLLRCENPPLAVALSAILPA